MKALGHHFRPYGSEEMICRQCDYVIWAVSTEAEAKAAVTLVAGHPLKCPHPHQDQRGSR
jgi:hypothetical protein